MKRKMIAMLMAATMLTAMLAGCGGEKSPDTSKKSEDGGEKKDVTISMMYCDGANEPYQKDWPVFEWIKEAAGVTLDMTIVPTSDYVAKRALIFNSGEIPDIVAHTFATSTDVASGILLPISDYEDQMPNYQAFIEKYDLRDEIDKTRFPDGKYYTLPCKAHTERFQDVQWMIRTDVFEKNNLPIPKTYKELLDVGMKLKELYPDSTPITNRFGTNHILQGLAAMFGTASGWGYGDGMLYDHDTGKWTFAPTTDNYRSFLEYTNQLYQTGVLDKEFATLDSVVYEQKIVNSETFIMFDWTANKVRYNEQGKQIDPDYNVSPIYPMEGPEGDYAVGWKSSWSQGYCFPATLAEDEEHLAEVLAYLDWGFTDEAETLLTFGKEGETYQVNDNGIKEFIEPDVARVKYGLNNNELTIREDLDAIYSAYTPEEMELLGEISKVVPATNPACPLDNDTLEDASLYISTLKDYVFSMTEKFIYGTEDLANWDAFVAECEAKGAIQLQEAYDEAVK